MPKARRFYVTVAGAHKIYSGTKLPDMVDAIWAHLGTYGRVWVKEKDPSGALRLLSVRLEPAADKLVITNEGGPRWEEWVKEMGKYIKAGPAGEVSVLRH